MGVELHVLCPCNSLPTRANVHFLASVLVSATAVLVLVLRLRLGPAAARFHYKTAD